MAWVHDHHDMHHPSIIRMLPEIAICTSVWELNFNRPLCPVPAFLVVQH